MRGLMVVGRRLGAVQAPHPNLLPARGGEGTGPCRVNQKAKSSNGVARIADSSTGASDANAADNFHWVGRDPAPRPSGFARRPISARGLRWRRDRHPDWTSDEAVERRRPWSISAMRYRTVIVSPILTARKKRILS